DETIDPGLLNLGRELIAIVLNQPNAFNTDIVDAPAFRGLFETIVDHCGLRSALKHATTHNHVLCVGVAPEREHFNTGVGSHLAEGAAISTHQRTPEGLDKRCALLRGGLAPV